MTKNTKLVWRLRESPTADKISLLVNTGILTKEEAREILLNQETKESRDMESLKFEIKFLRELVEKLSDRSQIVEIIKEIKVPYYRQDWWRPYEIWYQTTGNIGTVDWSLQGTGTNYTSTAIQANFSDINTF
jgi:hypothetical protein